MVREKIQGKKLPTSGGPKGNRAPLGSPSVVVHPGTLSTGTRVGQRGGAADEFGPVWGTGVAFAPASANQSSSRESAKKTTFCARDRFEPTNPNGGNPVVNFEDSVSVNEHNC